MGSIFTYIGWVFQTNHAYGHGEFVYHPTPWYFVMFSHSWWCLSTLVAKIFQIISCLHTIWDIHYFGNQSKAYNYLCQRCPSTRLLLAEVKDGQQCWGYCMSCFHCHLPIEYLPYFIYGDKKGWQPCCCVTYANNGGLWHAWLHPSFVNRQVIDKWLNLFLMARSSRHAMSLNRS